MMTALTALRDKLALVSGVATCKIGMESNLTAADYPMVRIVPSTVKDANVLGQRSADCMIYFGQPIHEFTAGLEALYASLFTMETALIQAAQSTAGIYVEYQETVLDEDRLEMYKLMCLRVMVQG